MTLFSVHERSRFIRAVTSTTLLVLTIAFPQLGKAHDPTVSLAGKGTPSIDGVKSSGEWDQAATAPINVNIPGGTTSAKLLAMSDSNNLYLGLLIQSSATDTISMVTEFDNDHDGISEAGDDAIVYNTNPYGPPSIFDVFRLPCAGDPANSAGCSTFDTGAGGTLDVTGASTNTGGFTFIEISHPLNSTDDAHDFSLNPGDVVGFNLFLRVFVGSGFADTSFPACASCINLYGDIVIPNPLILVSIDFKPKIKVGSNGMLPVTILTTSSFNASTVDPATVRFGLTGSEATAAGYSFVDVDADGDLDLQLRFRINATGINCGATSAILKGKTISGKTIRGSGMVSPTGCP
jgi:hypothetical protein